MCSSEREWVIATPSRTHQATHTHTHSGGVTAWLSSRQWWVMVSRNGGGFLWGGGGVFASNLSFFREPFACDFAASERESREKRLRMIFFLFCLQHLHPQIQILATVVFQFESFPCVRDVFRCANRLLYERRTKNGLRCAVVKTPQGYARQTHLFIFSHSPIPDPMDISQPFTYMTWTIYASTSRGHIYICPRPPPTPSKCSPYEFIYLA